MTLNDLHCSPVGPAVIGCVRPNIAPISKKSTKGNFLDQSVLSSAPFIQIQYTEEDVIKYIMKREWFDIPLFCRPPLLSKSDLKHGSESRRHTW